MQRTIDNNETHPKPLVFEPPMKQTVQGSLLLVLSKFRNRISNFMKPNHSFFIHLHHVVSTRSLLIQFILPGPQSTENA
jgi:hypothetical protein